MEDDFGLDKSLDKNLNKDVLESNSAVDILNKLISDAILKNAGDIHIEPFENTIRIRYRIDGCMYVIKNFDIKILDALIARLKIIANMDISEKRLPQDGNFKFNDKVSFRVSTLPTINGEKAVIRLIYVDNNNLNKNNLGFFECDLANIEKLFKNTYGAIIITGPTGSGKTTTLNSFIKDLNTEQVNIITVEDPVENIIYGVNQVNINPKINFDFPESLRTILRQDPDIIMLGEIRDSKTASIAMRSAITGHLVLSTLHTNDAISSIIRLKDMGVENFMISSALRGVISQRLVRRFCPKCKKKTKLKKSDLEILGLAPNYIDYEIYESVGCDACNNIGYKNRLAVYEYFLVDDKIKYLISSNNCYDDVKKYLLEQKNFKTLKENAIKNILSGNTSIDEVYKKIILEH